MPEPFINPDGRAGGQFRTGKIFSFSFNVNFSITNVAPTFTAGNSPINTVISGGGPRAFYSHPVLTLSGSQVRGFQGLGFQYVWARNNSDPDPVHGSRGGIRGWYGADNGLNDFVLDDQTGDPAHPRYYTITGSVRFTIDQIEEWKVVQVLNGQHAMTDDTLRYYLYALDSANYFVDVQVNNPYVLPVFAPRNHITGSGSLYSLGIRGLQDVSTLKSSLLNILVGVAPPQPGGKTTCSISFEDGAGTGLYYSHTAGGGTLTVADTALTMDRGGPELNAYANINSEPYTPVTVDGLLTKLHEPNFGSDVVLNSTLPGRGIYTAPLGIWSEVIDCTQREISMNAAVVLSHAGQKEFQIRVDEAWGGANGVPAASTTTQDDGGIWIYDDTCWPATTFRHAASVLLDDFASVTGWSGAGVAVSSSSCLRLVASGAGRSVYKSYDRDVRNYRYWRIPIQCDAGTVGHKIVFTIGGKLYSVVPTGVGPMPYDIDLMGPDPVVASAIVLADTTNSAWEPQGPITGVELVGTIGILLPNSTSDVTIGSFSVVRHKSSLPGWILPEQMPALNVYEAYHSDGYQGSDTWNALRTRFFGAICDGKPVCELYYAQRLTGTLPFFRLYNGITTGGGLYYERLSMNNIVDEINSSRQLGCSATPIQEVTSRDITGGPNYYGGKLFADYLTLDSPGTRVPWGVDLSERILNAWPQYGKVRIYAGFAGGYRLRFTKRVWGSCTGTVVSSSPAGQQVVVSSSLGTDEILTTDADGFFRSAPRATLNIFQFVAHKTVGVVRRVIDGMYRWTGFFSPAAPPPFQNPYNAHHPTWGGYLAPHVRDGNILFNASHGPVPLGGFDITDVAVTTTGQDSHPRAIYDRTGAQRLILVFDRQAGGGFDVWQTISTDDGQTWGAAVVLIPGARKPTPACDDSGTIIIAGYAGTTGGSGPISAVAQAAGDVSPSAVFNLRDSTGADLVATDDTFGISAGPDGARRWILAIVIAGDAGISHWYSTDWDARTWTKVV